VVVNISQSKESREERPIIAIRVAFAAKMKTDLEGLWKNTVITQETYEWLKPLHDQETADLEEIRRAALERKNNPFYDNDSEDEDGLLTTTTTTLEGIEGTPFSVRFVSDTNSSGHGNKVWHASIATCRYLKHRFLLPSNEESFRCLELGAGTAVPSLFLAKLIASSTERGPHTVLRITDAKYYRNIMQILRSVDLDRHEPVPADASVKIEVHPHNWGEPIGFGKETGTADPSSPHDLVIVSDCIYNPEYHDDLLASLSRTLAIPLSGQKGGIAVVSFSLHGNVKDEVIWDFLESKLPSQKLTAGRVEWRLQAKCVSFGQNIAGDTSNQEHVPVREGWDMENTMNELGMETEGIKPERWIAYVYEITWVPIE